MSSEIENTKENTPENFTIKKETNSIEEPENKLSSESDELIIDKKKIKYINKARTINA